MPSPVACGNSDKQRQQQAARAGAEVEEAQRRVPFAILRQRRFDHGLALGPRDQHRGPTANGRLQNSFSPRM